MPVVFANASNFEESIAKGTVILDFDAHWCARCRMIGPVLEQIAEENSDIHGGLYDGVGPNGAL